MLAIILLLTKDMWWILLKILDLQQLQTLDSKNFVRGYKLISQYP